MTAHAGRGPACAHEWWRANADTADAEPADEPPTPTPTPTPPEPEHRCDLCGAPMQEWHCRIICTFCGYQRDCSDP